MKEKKEEKTTDLKRMLTTSGLHVVSGIGGVLVGSALGTWPSAAAGLLTTLAGAYYKKDWAITGGIVMMTNITPVLKRPDEEVEGFKDEVEDAKDRVVNTFKMLGRKLMLHKMSPSMARTMELNGAEDGMLLYGDEMGEAFNTSEVDEIIRQLEEGNAEELIEENGYEGYDSELVEDLEVNGLDAISLAASA